MSKEKRYYATFSIPIYANSNEDALRIAREMLRYELPDGAALTNLCKAPFGEIQSENIDIHQSFTINQTTQKP